MIAGQEVQPIEAAGSVLELGTRAAQAYGRSDLLSRLSALEDRLHRPEVHVAVVGQFKSGKSRLVNALVGAEVCPVDDGLSTVVPTMVRWADRPCVAVFFEAEDASAEPRRERADLADLASLVTEAGNVGNHRRVRLVEVGVPQPVLQSGLVLLDTPGAGGLLSALATPAVAVLSNVDAVLFTTCAAQELSRPEMELLTTVASACPTVLVGETKIDLTVEWRRIAALDGVHLATDDRQFPVIGLSASVRQHAAAKDDQQANEESGFGELGRRIREVVASVEELHVRAVSAEVDDAGAQMAASFEAERAVLTGQTTTTDLVHLQEATAKAESLRRASAKWAQHLNDGIGDISGDIDHGLRDRLRTLLEGAEQMIDDGDPLTGFDEMVAWTRQQVSGEVLELYRELDARIATLAAEVGALFAEERDESRVVGSSGDGVQVILGGIVVGEGPEPGDRAPALGLTAVRGGYIGMLMFSTLGSLAGLVVLTPIAGVVGILMGRKALRDEKKRQLTLRRQQSKVAVRKYVDDVSFRVSKDARDALRRLHRELRDAFSVRAEEVSRAAASSLDAAQRAVGLGADERRSRLAQVDAELRRLTELRRRAAGLQGLLPTHDSPAAVA